MAKVQLSTLAEGTLVRAKLASGSYEQYVVAKHNYESGLNGNGLILLVETSGRIGQEYISSYMNTDLSWFSSYCRLSDALNSSSYRSRFGSSILNLIQRTTIYSDSYPGIGYSTGTCKFFIPSAKEFGVTSGTYSTESGTALSSTVLSKITRTNVWTRSTSNQYTEYEYDGETLYAYEWFVWFDANGKASYKCANMNGYAYYNLAFCLPAKALVDTDSSNEITGELYFEDDEEDSSDGPYLGVAGVARKVPRMLWGVGGVARKVRKCYAGDKNGKAQLWFEGMPATIGYTLSPVSSLEWTRFGAGVNGKYAVVGGGKLNDDYTNTVLAFEKTTLSATFAASLTSARARVVGTSAGNLAYIAAGGDGSSRYKTAFYYDQNLSMSAFDLSYKHTDGAGARAGDYGLIAGGEDSSVLGTNYGSNSVEAVTGAATRTTATSLPTNLTGSGGGQMGDKAVIAGGSGYDDGSSTQGYTYVVLYDKDLTQSTFPEMEVGRRHCGVAGSKRILVIAGSGSSNSPMTYELYSADGTKLGGTYSMNYGGWLSGGFVKTKTEEYPYGLICMANMSGLLGWCGKDGTLVLQQATGLDSTSATYHHLAAADFGDEVLIPLVHNGDKVAQFKAQE